MVLKREMRCWCFATVGTVLCGFSQKTLVRKQFVDLDPVRLTSIRPTDVNRLWKNAVPASNTIRQICIWPLRVSATSARDSLFAPCPYRRRAPTS
jgi:hypothetical protein